MSKIIRNVHEYYYAYRDYRFSNDLVGEVGKDRTGHIRLNLINIGL